MVPKLRIAGWAITWAAWRTTLFAPMNLSLLATTRWDTPAPIRVAPSDVRVNAASSSIPEIAISAEASINPAFSIATTVWPPAMHRLPSWRASNATASSTLFARNSSISGIDGLHPFPHRGRELSGQLRRTLFHDPQTEFAQTSDDRYLGAAMHFCFACAELDQAQLAVGVDHARPATFFALGHTSEPRGGMLIGDLDDDDEARLDRAKGHH